jgi:DNA-binding phage protein
MIEPIEDSETLRPLEKVKLARLALRLAIGDSPIAPGTFLRAHIAQLDQTLHAADRANARERNERAQRPLVNRPLTDEQRRIQKATATAIDMVDQGASQTEAARGAGIGRNTLARALARRKAEPLATGSQQ